MGFCYPIHLDDHHEKRTIYRCNNCHSHLFTSDNIVSDNFKGRTGKGYLVKKVVNFKPSLIEMRQMMTGKYSVADTDCQQCGNYIGWKYIKAWDPCERYKEGSFVIELEQLYTNASSKL